MNDEDLLSSEEKSRSEDWRSWTPREFLSTTIHELRTPIMFIKCWTELLSNEESKELHPKAIENIFKSIGRLEEVMDDMSGYLRKLMEES
jgi:signal transduction histidine kinase